MPPDPNNPWGPLWFGLFVWLVLGAVALWSFVVMKYVDGFWKKVKAMRRRAARQPR